MTFELMIFMLLDLRQRHFLVVVISQWTLDDFRGILTLNDNYAVRMASYHSWTVFPWINDSFDHPKILAATKRIADTANRYGKHWGRPAGSTEEAQQYLDMNARFVACGADIVTIKSAHEALQYDFAKLGFTFENKLG